jgi:hypothetical protein
MGVKNKGKWVKKELVDIWVREGKDSMEYGKRSFVELEVRIIGLVG